MQKRALAGAMVMSEMGRVRTVADCPLRPLFYGKEAELTITFARRGLPFPHLRADAFRGLSRAVTDKQYLLQPWDSLFGSSNDNSIANRRAVLQDSLVYSIEGRVTAALGRCRHHRAHGASWLERGLIRRLVESTIISLRRVPLALNLHRIILMGILTLYRGIGLDLLGLGRRRRLLELGLWRLGCKDGLLGSMGMLRGRLGDDRLFALGYVLGHGHLLAHGLLVDQVIQRSIAGRHLVVVRVHLVITRGQMVGGCSLDLTRARNRQLWVGLLVPGAILHTGEIVYGRWVWIREDVVRIGSLWWLLRVEGLLLIGSGVLWELVGSVWVALGTADPIVD